tara:strand:+ start:48174 stop:49040 length:867 start_codon:yes stop_codon:yes gene_type:complete
MNYEQPQVIAEIGCSHLGDFERAKELCRLAKLCGAPYVKTQKRNPHESTPLDIRDKPHPNKLFAYGDTYLEHRINLEFSIEKHAELQSYCDSIGIVYTTSVWDMTSAREVAELSPPLIKIPSACNQHYDMLEFLSKNYEGDLHISTGMTTREEMSRLLDFVEASGIQSRTVIYHCTSKYPCDFKDLHLLEIPRLKSMLEGTPIRIGFSNHGKGIAADIAGYMLGAEWIERHFIDDRTVRHTDAAASLEPGGLSRLVRDLQAVKASLDYRPIDMDDEELAQRKKLKFKG